MPPPLEERRNSGRRQAVRPQKRGTLPGPRAPSYGEDCYMSAVSIGASSFTRSDTYRMHGSKEMGCF